MSFLRRTLAAAVAVAFGCSQPTGPQIAPVVRIELVSFDPGSGLRVTFTFTNKGSHEEYVAACGGQVNAVLERYERNGWQPFAGGFCLAHLSHVPISVLPGATVSGSTGAARAEAGTYQVVLFYDSNWTPRVLSAPFPVG